MSAGNPMLHEALRAVAGQAETLTTAGPLSIAFYHWVLAEGLSSQQSAAMARDLCEEIAGGGRSIHAVAALGFLLSIDPTLSDACRDSFAQGVDWLVGRRGDSQTALVSLMQPLAHTGVLVGLLATSDDVHWPKFGAWFASLYAKLQPLLPAEVGWRHELLSMIKTRSEVGLNGELAVVPATAGAAIYVARRLADASPAVDNDFASQLLSRIKSVVYDDPEQAALDLAAFHYLAQGAAQIDLRAPSLDDVGLLLRRLPSGLRRWTWDEQKKTPNSTAQKWAVENEYHFQNLLCAVLAPVLPDLRDEEWLASVGQKKPRADLVVPSLHLVIEVKYWRKSSTPQDLISQIGEDVSLYLKRGSPYRKVLPIIWDQGRRTEQYDLLIAGLSEIRDVVSPVVIAQPAFMV
ncbi:hypothetical protein CP913_23270 [Pseudomonas aeruginosa]|uniref:PD-(D/E)XK nuclease domain-containing protein n=1 Tax=Pseudomonas aeruginosa TaxID=287 RepID=UPI000BC8D3C4|nr:hypothetical protein [Pseudomonas aeruginosa]AXN27663.2 hypothetical protein CP913_23270 [Pseudomonas aeruginosa]PCM95148.1 hypothetical protein CP916_26970 [Pseudomonas aeruginosa]PCN06279.1 hypothetical protein CP915_02300 [Pseudomonas aeruginosa]PCN10205.1 hypothetical protein CP914_26785 [Pseudomonas aeruginosa]UFM90681.1 hypothetical protein LO758_06730 [Pseudomonas aeruginosa]